MKFIEEIIAGVIFPLFRNELKTINLANLYLQGLSRVEDGVRTHDLRNHNPAL